MMQFTQGNLLDAHVDAVVNTVNTVGIMGKGIALLFKERFPDNMKAYGAACKREEVKIGSMFVTEQALLQPRWIINFPTKQHWRSPSRIEWIEAGLDDLVRVIQRHGIKSIALPPLGCGNGGLDWSEVRPLIERKLAAVADQVQISVFEPTDKYHNVSKRAGVKELTPARALIAEAIRRYWHMGLPCSILEVQKLAWFLERAIERTGVGNPLDLRFEPNQYGPYSNRLQHLLDGLDGSWLQCDKRLADAKPSDEIWLIPEQKEKLAAYLNSGETKKFVPAIEYMSKIVDGFESPLGLEALSTIDWLLETKKVDATVSAIRGELAKWPAGPEAGARKNRIFSDELIQASLERVASNLGISARK